MLANYAMLSIALVAAQTQDTDAAPPQETGSTYLGVPGQPFAFSAHAEIGFVAPLAHTIQFGREGSRIDYIEEGGQDNLFPFARLSVEAALWQHHQLVLLYQPLTIDTQVEPRRDIQVDELVFEEGRPVRFLYGFDFWRASYLYDFFADPRTELAVGASLQIRNATIGFESLDGAQARYKRDIGPVPIIKVRGRTDLGSHLWLGGEFDGFWAPIRYLNGGSSDVEGAIADLALRGGLHLAPGVDGFVGLRYLGGGAVGTSNNDKTPGDGYVDNWLHFASVTIGFTLR